MKSNIKYISIIILLSSVLLSCHGDWLERNPKTIILEEQVWNDARQIEGLLANFYDRLPVLTGLQGNWREMTMFDDAMWSGYAGEEWRNQMRDYNPFYGEIWDYGLVRDINLSIEGIAEYSVDLSENQKSMYQAELRFIRAYLYFEMGRRMGGIPLITEQLLYDFSGDPTYLQHPRAKESEVYDFIAKEMDEIKDLLGNGESVSRANKYTALALKSRAMLYAGSLAKYNNLLGSPITTPGGEVGIPASKANEYYRASLNASLEIINSNEYGLYQNNPQLGENFYEIFEKKTSNNEVIWVKDFLAPDKRHLFSYDNIARGLREDNLASSCITPSLNLVESFPYLDGSEGTLKTRTNDNSDYIYYDDLSSIYNNKDWRLYGTVLYSGVTFKGLPASIQAGVKVPTAIGYDTEEGEDIGTNYSDGGVLVGGSGPHRSMQEVSNTGFYLRKLIQSGAGTSTRGVQSDNWWIYFRLGEIYLNAAEAAMELEESDAVKYVNTLRERAGYPSNSLSSINLEVLMNERRIELAFEGHRYFDLKRWRKAHILWDGNRNDPTTMIYALYPYRIVGGANDGKYVFEKMIAPRFLNPRYFELKNYYTFIPQHARDNNPKIVPNPFQ